MAGVLQHYFAWANYGDAFDPTVHNREDVQIYEIELGCTEANLPTATITIQNPGIGILNPSYANGMRWAYISYYNEILSEIVPIFFGRIVSIPQDLFGLLVKIMLRCEPPDLLVQKQTLMVNSLMQLPYWDPVFISSGQRLDPETALEGYAAVWQIDAVTAQANPSNVAVGEDGVIVWGSSDAFWNSVKVTIEKAPKRSIYIDADIKWLQYDVGYINLETPTYTGFAGAAFISGWPKFGTSIGKGYTAWFGYAFDAYGVGVAPTFETHKEWKNTDKQHNVGDTMSVKIDMVQPIFPYGAYTVGYISYNIAAVIFAPNPFDPGQDAQFGQDQLTSQPEAVSYNSQLNIPLWYVPTILIANYEARRDRTENVRMMLNASLQNVFTDPGGVAANFALDSEYMQIHGDVGLEIPYGTFVGTWQPFTFYPRFSIIQAEWQGKLLCFQVDQDIWSLDVFDPAVVGTAWLPTVAYIPGQIVINIITHETFEVEQPIISDTLIVPATILGVDFVPVFKQLDDWHQGAPLYRELPHYRGNWATATTYVAGDIFFAPDGNTLKVAVGHTSDTYSLFNTDPTGRLLYQLLVNPPAIGFLGSRWYFPTPRGQQSLQNLILRGRSRLLTVNRVFKVTFACSWDFASANGVSLRKNGQLTDFRLPGGVIEGKITSFKYTFKGGSRQCEITIQAIPGEAVATEEVVGEPTYGSTDYMGNDYQQFTGTVIALPVGDVSYTPPVPDLSADDGITFPLTTQEAVYNQSFIVNTDNIITAIEEAYVNFDIHQETTIPNDSPTQAQQALLQAFTSALTQEEDIYELVLNPIQNGPFSVEYDVVLSVLSLPKQVDLSAAPIVPVYQGP